MTSGPDDPIHSLPPGPLRLTDSPWFWAVAFSLVSLVGIGLIASKFDARQRQIEGRFLGREHAARERARRAAGLPPINLAAEAEIVPLWTLAAAAGLATLGSGAMLAREWRKR